MFFQRSSVNTGHSGGQAVSDITQLVSQMRNRHLMAVYYYAAQYKHNTVCKKKNKIMNDHWCVNGYAPDEHGAPLFVNEGMLTYCVKCYFSIGIVYICRYK